MLIKFSFIVVCFLIAVFSRNQALERRDHMLLMCALLATVVADYFLIVAFIYPVGVTVFWFAHVFYALRFGGPRIWRFFPLVLPVPIVALVVLGDVLVATSLVYAGLFVISFTTMLRALKTKKYPAPNNILIFLGMTLFVLCDIFVAIFNLGGMGAFDNHALTEFAVDAIWLFYAPSQICLALSGIKYESSSQRRPRASVPTR
ncbi:MAG: lysoplasmalogenase [Defluviitaleaceae bacterium]|nr:lysoplasmalogenase [Defluviitaleaceae bacterium]